MNHELTLQPHGQHAAGKCTICNRAVEQLEGRPQAAGHRCRSWAELHWVCVDVHSVTAFRGSGNGDGNLPANRGLAKERAHSSALGNIIGAEFSEIRLGIWKTLDEIRAAESEDYGRFARRKNLIH